ncbi:MAG: dihydroorotate dehydrogenase [Pseudomonadota bacterium]
MADLSLTLGGVDLRSPVLPASGTFGLRHGEVFDLGRLGAVVPKTLTLHPRKGHPPPRFAEVPGGLINAIGIPSPGIEAARQNLATFAALGPPLIVSISADTAEEFGAAAAALEATQAAALELNLSCPNLEGDGHLFAADPAAARRAVRAARAATARPIWCKLSPAVGAAGDVARACAEGGAAALIVGNTMPAMAFGKAGAPILSNRTGGLSGQPLKPVMLRLLDEISRATSLPLVGCGGVETLDDLLDVFSAGGSAAAIGSATLRRPSAMARVLDALDDYLDATSESLAALTARRRQAACAPATVQVPRKLEDLCR